MNNMTEKVKKVKKFLEKENIDGMQTFFTRNIVGDPMVRIYSDNTNNVFIDICYEYDYLEIFGLTEQEQDQLRSNTKIR